MLFSIDGKKNTYFCNLLDYQKDVAYATIEH